MKHDDPHDRAGRQPNGQGAARGARPGRCRPNPTRRRPNVEGRNSEAKERYVDEAGMHHRRIIGGRMCRPRILGRDNCENEPLGEPA